MLGTLSVSWDTFFARDAINVYQASFRLVSLLHAKRACNVYRLSLSLFLHGFLQGFSVTGTAQIRKASCDEQSAPVPFNSAGIPVDEEFRHCS